jgi:hypothetical protein
MNTRPTTFAGCARLAAYASKVVENGNCEAAAEALGSLAGALAVLAGEAAHG